MTPELIAEIERVLARLRSKPDAPRDTSPRCGRNCS